MDEFDRAHTRIQPVIRALCRWSLLMKRIVLTGFANFIRSGGNIIVANHIGSYKDIAVLLSVVPRRIFFMANARIFSQASFQDVIRKRWSRHMRGFGTGLDLFLAPAKNWFARTISDNIAAIGTIPVDLDRRNGRASILFRDYLLKNRAVISLQGMGIRSREDGHPFVPPFRPGPAALSYALYEHEGLDIPVTPVAILGTQTAWGIPAKIQISIGEPMFISEDLRGNRSEAVGRFRERLEARVKELLIGSLRYGRHD